MVPAHQEPVEEFLETIPPPPSEKKKRKKKTKIKKPETIADLKVLRKMHRALWISEFRIRDYGPVLP